MKALCTVFIVLSFLVTDNCRGKQKIKSPLPGYSLVWNDEFDYSPNGQKVLPDQSKWRYETGKHGWGNNELQNYVAGFAGADTIAFISNGTLKIVAQKHDNEVISARINTNESWLYGYFEARLKLPQGKGTWPAFWMLPVNFTKWPDDGEIDIMEEVGVRPNWISASIHCKAYNHRINTQKTAEKFIRNAESEFHVYAVEWTPDYVRGYVDNEQYFEFLNDKTGNKDSWTFNSPFYLKLNLAWGGNWGGMQGVDETKLPATYEIDYVRVFQK
jgi:beta-glucanase (GH16 family)